MQKQYLNYVVGSAIILALWIGSYTVIVKIENIQRKELKNQFIQTQKNFKTIQKLKYDRLVESAYLLAENSTFKANLQLNDPASVKFSISDFSRFMKIDVFTVVGKTGTVLAEIGGGLQQGTIISEDSALKEALNGKEPDITITWPLLISIHNTLYHVVSVPVYAGRNNIIGAIQLGIKVSKMDLLDLKQSYVFDVLFIHGNEVIESSVSEPAKKDFYSRFFNTYVNPEALYVGAEDQFLIMERTLNSKTIISFASPLGKGEKAYYMCGILKDQALGFAQKFKNYVISFAAILTLSIGYICFKNG